MALPAPAYGPLTSDPKGADLARSWPFLTALFAVAPVAFWPSYLSRRPGSSSGYTHLHALSAALWMLVL